MVMATPLLAAIGGVILAYIVVVKMKWVGLPRFSRDPRWKNHKQIIDFIAWSLIGFVSIAFAIYGVMTQ